MKKMLKEFRDFAVKGNVIDLAVGVIIGGAFGKIVTSLVNDIIMPIVGIVLGGNDLAKLNWTIQNAGKDPVVFAYGKFLQNVVDFLIIAICIFLMVKVINRLNNLGQKVIKEKLGKSEEKATKIIEKPKTELDILIEIRNLLKTNTKTKKRK